MKALAFSLAVVLVVAGQFGCGKKDKDNDDKNNDKGAIDTTIDYVTGYTAVEAKFRAERNLIQSTIGNAVNMFIAMEGRRPTSLEALVDADYLTKKFLKDEYGKPLQSGVRDGQFEVRSMRLNKKTGRTEENWSQRY